jgi:nucleotide-binding universal stress UspA family protein
MTDLFRPRHYSQATGITSALSSDRPRVVVGVDGSECSLEALRQAISIGRSRNAVVDTVTVWHFPYISYSQLPALLSDPEGDAGTCLRNALDQVLGSDRPDWLRAWAIEGTPSRTLMRESAGAEMLVLGSRGRGGISGMRPGSVSSACAAHATCPVLVIHNPRHREAPSPAMVPAGEHQPS